MTAAAENMEAESPVKTEVPAVAATAPPTSEFNSARPPSLFRLLMQCVLIGVLAYSSYFLVSHYVLQSVQVVGNSMSPTLQNMGRYLLNRWVYLVREPQRADIVVIRDPADEGYSVKRIIGSAGDTIRLKGGQIYVNGRLLEEPYLLPGTPTFAEPGKREQSVVCGKDQYFVLGDNRNNSADSRVYGPVSRSKILGLIIH